MARYSFLAIPYNKVGFLKKKPSYAQTIKKSLQREPRTLKEPPNCEHRQWEVGTQSGDYVFSARACLYSKHGVGGGQEGGT